MKKRIITTIVIMASVVIAAVLNMFITPPQNEYLRQWGSGFTSSESQSVYVVRGTLQNKTKQTLNVKATVIIQNGTDEVFYFTVKPNEIKSVESSEIVSPTIPTSIVLETHGKSITCQIDATETSTIIAIILLCIFITLTIYLFLVIFLNSVIYLKRAVSKINKKIAIATQNKEIEKLNKLEMKKQKFEEHLARLNSCIYCGAINLHGKYKCPNCGANVKKKQDN